MVNTVVYEVYHSTFFHHGIHGMYHCIYDMYRGIFDMYRGIYHGTVVSTMVTWYIPWYIPCIPWWKKVPWYIPLMHNGFTMVPKSTMVTTVITW